MPALQTKEPSNAREARINQEQPSQSPGPQTPKDIGEVQRGHAAQPSSHFLQEGSVPSAATTQPTTQPAAAQPEAQRSRAAELDPRRKAAIVGRTKDGEAVLDRKELEKIHKSELDELKKQQAPQRKEAEKAANAEIKDLEKKYGKLSKHDKEKVKATHLGEYDAEVNELKKNQRQEKQRNQELRDKWRGENGLGPEEEEKSTGDKIKEGLKKTGKGIGKIPRIPGLPGLDRFPR